MPVPQHPPQPLSHIGLFLRCSERHAGPQFPSQGLNPHPLQWKYRALITGWPGKSQVQNLSHDLQVLQDHTPDSATSYHLPLVLLRLAEHTSASGPLHLLFPLSQILQDWLSKFVQVLTGRSSLITLSQTPYHLILSLYSSPLLIFHPGIQYHLCVWRGFHLVHC